MNRIKELRKEKNLTQSQLAEKFNLDQTAVSKWELGKALPDATTLQKLSEYFDVSIDYILGNSSFYYPDNLEQKNAPQNPNVQSEEEQRLLDMFRNMSHPQKIRFLAFGEGLTEPISSSKKNQ